MKMDVDAPQGDIAETQKLKKKVVRAESEETERLRFWDAGNQPGRSRGALSEPRGSIFSATIAAVTKLSGTDSSRRMWVKRVRKPTQ